MNPRYMRILYLVVIAIGLISTVQSQDLSEKQTILVLHDLGHATVWEEQFAQGLTTQLRSHPALNFDISYEFPGLEFIPEGEVPDEIIAYLTYKNTITPVDLVIAVLPLSNTFLLEYGEEIFPDIPQIFVLPGADETAAILELPQSIIIETASDVAFQNTLNSIPQLLPEIEQLYFVAGASERDQAYVERARNALNNSAASDLRNEFLVNISLDELLARATSLPDNSAIFMLPFSIDADGNHTTPVEVTNLISENTNIPIFASGDTMMGSGIVGGNLTSATLYGKTTANIVLDIVTGTPSYNDLLVVGDTAYVYDWRQLQRLNIPENRLPANSVVRFKPFSFWETYRTSIITAIVVMFIQTVSIFMLIVALRQRHHAVHTAKKRETEFRVIFENSRDAILVSSNGIVVMVNRAFLKMFGYTDAAQMVGKPVGTNIVPEERERIQDYALKRRMNMDVSSMYETRAQTVSGEKFDLEIHVASYELNTMTFDVALLRNISERKRMEALIRETEVLQIELDKEKKLLELRERFISFLSHEFRAPLAVMQTSLDLLIHYQDRLSPERRTAAREGIGAQIKRLTEMIDNTLNLLRAQSENLKFSPVVTDVVQLCGDILEQAELVDKKGHRYHFSADCCLQYLMLDINILKHVLVNLLSNAAKYSPVESDIHLKLSQFQDTIHIEVRDEGIGIPVEDQKNLFESFHRAGNVGNVKGTGLGLLVVKQYAEAHGGTIEFKSEVGKGSTFTVILPLVPAELEKLSTREYFN